jgi:hypothetical protein
MFKYPNNGMRDDDDAHSQTGTARDIPTRFSPLNVQPPDRSEQAHLPSW